MTKPRLIADSANLNSIDGNRILDSSLSNAKVSQISSNKLSFLQELNGAVIRSGRDKCADIVSVKDFGAVGDNSDDTEAINAALATGKPIYFPSGIYLSSGGHVIASSGQYIVGDGPWESKLKRLSGDSEFLRVAKGTNGCGVENIGFDCNQLAGTMIRWKSHYSLMRNVIIENGAAGNNQWGLHVTDVNLSQFDNVVIQNVGGCLLIDQNNDTDPVTSYSCLYTKFSNLVLVPLDKEAIKIEGQAQDIVFDDVYIECTNVFTTSTTPYILFQNPSPISGISFYNLGCEHNILGTPFIDIIGSSVALKEIYNITFRGGRFTSGVASQDKSLIRANKVSNLIVDGAFFYCDTNLPNRPHLELTDCTDVKITNNLVYSYPNDFVFIKDYGGCERVTEDTNNKLRINVSGGSGTNLWGNSSNIAILNSGMAQSYSGTTQITNTDYQLAPLTRAYRSSPSTLAHNTPTIWSFSSVDLGYNPNDAWDQVSYRFTPDVAGFYYVTIKGILNTSGADCTFSALIYKNGTLFSSNQSSGTGGGAQELGVTHTDLVYLNGSTDFIEGYFYQFDYTSGAGRVVQSDAAITVNFIRSI